MQFIGRLSGRNFLYVRLVLRWRAHYIIILRSNTCLVAWFFWDPPQDLEWTNYPWGQNSPMHRSLSWVSQDLSNLGLLCHTSWMELWKIHHQKPHEIEVLHEQLLVLEPELLILHEMLSYQYISLHVIRDPAWLVQICCLAIFHPGHTLEIPMCGYF